MSENLEENIENPKISKKILLITFLLFMLFLNIFDFLNLLPADLDFIEKILSWTLFGYIFYEASLTKIFIGTKKKIYDLIYILAFCLIGITKSLVYYAKDSTFIPSNYNFFLFEFILSSLRKIDSNNIITYAFFLGLAIIIVNSIFLLKRHNIEEKSLLGSIEFKEYSKFLKLHYLTLIIISIFFAVVVFNFFMEWFALAIDDFMPIIGLIYYLFKYIHLHTQNKISNYLNDVNNSGQNFFENVIEKFSDKKTILIAISFLLTLHLIVDFGVYIVPYTTGIENGLYFENLNTAQREHTAIINFFDYEKSRIYLDLNSNNEFLIKLSVILIYFMSIITISSLLILPFFIYYKNIQKQEIKINNKIAIFLLSGIIFLPIITFLPNVNFPLNIAFPDSSLEILGVDIYTKNIISENFTSKNFIEILSSIIILFVIFGFLLFRYEKYKIFFDKLILTISILFFLTYIAIFYLSTTNYDYNYITSEIKNPLIKDDTAKYLEFYSTYQNPNYYKTTLITKNKEDTVIAFTTINQIDTRYLNYTAGQNHKDYLLITKNINPQKTYQINTDSEIIHFEKPQKIKNNLLYPNEEKITFIYQLEENSFIFKESSRGYTLSETPKYENLIEENKTSKINKLLFDITIYTKFLLLSFFYIFGSLEFATYFTRKNILHTT